MVKTLPLFCFVGLNPTRGVVGWIKFAVDVAPLFLLGGGVNLGNAICEESPETRGCIEQLLQYALGISPHKPSVETCLQGSFHMLSNPHRFLGGDQFQTWDGIMMGSARRIEGDDVTSCSDDGDTNAAGMTRRTAICHGCVTGKAGVAKEVQFHTGDFFGEGVVPPSWYSQPRQLRNRRRPFLKILTQLRI